jgi:translation initiation factor IF-3
LVRRSGGEEKGGVPISEQAKKNEEIRGKTFRVIGPEGQQLGIMLLDQARLKAHEFQLDLVEVAPKATPPVCRIMDYGKHVYEEQKKEQHARKKSHGHDLKEVRLKPRIGKHDLEIKIARAKEFLSEGHRVQFTMVYRGREITHQDIGQDIMNGVVTTLGDVCKVERGPFREGKRVGLIVAPKQGGGEKPVASARPVASSAPKQASPAVPHPVAPATPAAPGA